MLTCMFYNTFIKRLYNSFLTSFTVLDREKNYKSVNETKLHVLLTIRQSKNLFYFENSLL